MERRGFLTGTDRIKIMRILNIEPLGYSSVARSLLEQWAEVVEKEMPRSQLLRELGDYDVLIVRLGHQIDRDVIETGHRLKAIVTATTGLDHIDVEYAERKGISVLSLRGETNFLNGISATAEHTFSLLLGLARWISPASRAVCRGEWNRDIFRGHELKGKSIGIVGLGRIGKKVARYAQAFEMDVAAYDPYADEWLVGAERKSTLADLLQSSEVLTLHVPLDSETMDMVGARELAMLPQGAVLVNTSRGELIDEVALVESLENKHLAGAALDVIRDERDVKKRLRSPLLAYAVRHDNLLITPHIGGATHESMAKTEVFMAQKLMRFFQELEGGATL
jgi:D-3-phosphoglycerate dehydrogenase / 2-oxoglutarate reductase